MTSSRRHARGSIRTELIILGCLVLLAGGVALGYFILPQWLPHQAATPAETTHQLWTCSMHPQVIRDAPGNCPICGMALVPMATQPTAGSPAAGSDKTADSKVIVIDPVMVQNMGVRLATVSRGPLRRTLRAVGMLEQPQPGVHDVTLRIGGWVEKLYANADGMIVERGRPLFDLYSPDIQVAVDELAVARRSVAALPADADANLRQMAESVVQAARGKLELWGLQKEQVEELAKLDRAPRTVAILSPATGEVAEKMVSEGAMIKMGERAMWILDRSVLWLEIQVHAQDMPFIHLGQKVQAETESMPWTPLEGQVIFIAPNVEAMTRTTMVRVALPNPNRMLRPGMYVTARIEATFADDALLVPREAVIDTGSRQLAFISLGQGRFEPRQVKLGVDGDDGLVQVEGLAAGESVVVSGQFLIDSESRMREAVRKYLNQKQPAPQHQH